jgi:hypothetical protein
MCKDCFEYEIKSFQDKTTWDKFDLELTKKLGTGKLKQEKFVGDGQRDKDDGFYIYKCESCGQRWKLKDALYDLTGAYFLKKSWL